MVLGIMEIHISCKYTHTDRGTGLFSRISGFNFFADPWYNNNALYVIYQQPPFPNPEDMAIRMRDSALRMEVA